MRNKLTIADKIMELPFGVIVSVIIGLAVVLGTIISVVALLIKINASLLFVTLLIIFAVVRSVYFMVNGK